MRSSVLSLELACQACGIKRTKLYQLIGSGDLQAVKIGRRTLVTRESVDALIERGIADAKRAWGL